jgi:DNA replication protein DnaC
MNFEDYAIEYSRKCNRCSGRRYVEEKEKMVICPCQLKALIKYRYDEIPVSAKTKELDWTDFTGLIADKYMNVSNWKKSRDIAFGYCFSEKRAEELNMCDYSNDDIEDLMKHRISKSKIQDRLNEGSNLFIMGEEYSGKTLLASLIAREIVFYSVLKKDIYFKWISFHSLINALSFNRIDYAFFDDITYTNDFLVLDNVFIPKQRNFMYNMLDELFYERSNKKKPIIVTGPFLNDDPITREKLGNEIFRIYNNHKTNKIKLTLEKTNV